MTGTLHSWLQHLGLGKYADVFVENEIDLELMPQLSERDLQELGLPLGPRKKLLLAIAGLRSPPAPVPRPANSETPAEVSSWSRTPGERKPVTMLFADIVGSTALTEHLDAEETHELLYGAIRDLCKEVERAGGTVCRFMGDGVMAMFGAPLADERHAVRACQAALSMQAAIVRCAADLRARYGCELQVRVGLHSGEVVVLQVGEPEHPEYDASGPTVPLAARMEQAAAPGTILLTSATHALAHAWIEAAAVAPVSVKGISEPVPVFRLERLHTVDEASALAERTPLVGRRKELDLFESLVSACSAGARGQMLLVRGEAGVGKTRLVEEFMAIARRQGLAVHRAQALDFGAGAGQDAVSMLVLGLLDLTAGSDQAARAAAARRAIASPALRADQQVFLNDFLEVEQSPELRALYDAMDNPARNHGKQQLVVDLVRGFSADRPVLLVVEDVHWANSSVLAHLAALSAASSELAVLLVLTTRPEGDPLDESWRSAAKGAADSLMLDLGPLGDDDATMLAGMLLEASGEWVRRCVVRAAGNPLFLVQLLRTAGAAADNVPDSIQGLVLAHLDRLPAPDKKALQVASILGQRVALDALRHLLGDDDYICDGLIKHHLARPEGESIAFAHALIRDSVYASLLKTRRRELHRRAAEWFFPLDAVLHAQHLDLAGESAAASAYLRAARQQTANYRYEQAQQLVERGLEISRSDADRYPLTCLRGELLYNLGSIPQSIEVYRTALVLAENDAQRCQAWIGVAEGLRIVDRYEDALAELDQAEAVARRQDMIGELARVSYLRGNLHFPLGQLEQCLEHHQRARDLAQLAHSPELEARALGGLGDAEYARGRMRSAYDNFSHCVQLCRTHGFRRIEVANLSMVPHTRIYLSEWHGVFEDSLSAIESAAQVGHRRAEIIARHAAFGALYAMGELDPAARQTDDTLELIRQLGARRFEAETLADQALVLLAQGQRGQALELLGRAMTISRETGIRFVGPWILGRIALATDDPLARQNALQEGEQLLRQGCVSHNYFYFYRDAMEASLDAGDWAEAERFATALEHYTRAEPLPWSDFHIARGRALAAAGSGQREHGEQSTRQALEELLATAQRLDWKTVVPALRGALGGGGL